MDSRAIKERDARKLTVDDIRALVRWCDNQRETWWLPDVGLRLSLASILRLYHAAHDHGFAGMDEWFGAHGCDRSECMWAWRREVGVAKRKAAR